MRPVVHQDPDTGHVVRSKVQLRTPCGKQGYSSRKLAASRAAVESRLTGETIHAYHCPNGCHAWHIGHPPRRLAS